MTTAGRRNALLALALTLALAVALVWRHLAAWGYDDLGNLALVKGDTPRAQSLFDRGLALVPDSHLLLEDRARAELDSDPATALRDFERAACGPPCVAGQGDAYARLGHPDEAVEAYLDAKAAHRLAAVVDVMASHGKYDEAIALEKALIQRLGDSIFLRADLAAAYSKVGMLAAAAGDANPSKAAAYHREAIAAFDRATALAPFNEGYLLSFAFAQMSWGDRHAAANAFRRVLALHPHQSDAEKALAQLGASPTIGP